MIDILIVLGYIVALLVLPSVIGSRVGASILSVSVVQMLGFITLALASYYFGVVGVFGAIAIALVLPATSVLGILYNYWVGKKALNGDFGDESRWLAELIIEQDGKFMQALSVVDDADVREVRIIAETKSEFRELMIERAEQKELSGIPTNGRMQ